MDVLYEPLITVSIQRDNFTLQKTRVHFENEGNKKLTSESKKGARISHFSRLFEIQLLLQLYEFAAFLLHKHKSYKHLLAGGDKWISTGCVVRIRGAKLG